MALTEKMKAFCREYFSNRGNGTQAYLAAYDSESEVAASIESSKLLAREDVQEYLATLNKPLEKKAQTEREKKRAILWGFIEDANKSDNDRLKAMDLLNKMDSEYININRNIDDPGTQLEGLTIEQLKQLSDAQTR